MDYIYIGSIVNTHGLKGEVRILSSISFKEQVFIPNFRFFIDGIPYKIISYRKHKNYDMVTFKGLSTIDDVLPLKGRDVFVKRGDLGSVFIENDYIGMEVYSDKGNRGTVISLARGPLYNYLQVSLKEKKYYIPILPTFIEKVDQEENKVFIHEIEGLIDEN